jgi:hypothetical protein
MRFAFGELWGDLAGWFLVGIFLSGLISALLPETIVSAHLGPGLGAMLIMLIAGVPLYICATASTPIAAALIMKGASPGAALVFLLAGPATNVTSLTVLIKILGRRATVLYLVSIALVAVGSGLFLDYLYALFGIPAAAGLGQAAELVPEGIQVLGAVILLGLSVKPVGRTLRGHLGRGKKHEDCGCEEGMCHLEGGEAKDAEHVQEGNNPPRA